MPNVVKNLAGGKAISGGSLQPRGRRGNTAQVASYWSGGGDSYIVATGGTTNNYTVGGLNYKSHTFTGNGTFTVSDIGSLGGLVDVHLVGGGGGGGWSFGAGGGGGGGRTQTSVAVTATGYSIVIGGAGSQIKNQNTGGDGGTTSGLGYSVGGGGGGSSNVSGAGAPANGSGGGGNINGIGAGAGSTYGGAGGAGVAGQGGGNGGSALNQPNTFRIGSNETYGIGGYGSMLYGNGAPAGGTTYGCGGGGGGNYNQVDYYGGASVAGAVIIRYRVE